jgi:hypothetical protein
MPAKFILLHMITLILGLYRNKTMNHVYPEQFNMIFERSQTNARGTTPRVTHTNKGDIPNPF